MALRKKYAFDTVNNNNNYSKKKNLNVFSYRCYNGYILLHKNQIIIKKYKSIVIIFFFYIMLYYYIYCPWVLRNKYNND